MDTCSVEGCSRPPKARGWCLPCYKRWWKLPEPRPAAPPPARGPRPTYRCESCGQETSGRGSSGLCHPCWLRRDAVEVEEVERYGIVFRRYPKSTNPSHREYYKPNATHLAAGVESLHREVYKREIGPIPDGFHVHHKDSDTSNNEPANLVALHPADHLEHTRAGWAERGGTWRDREAMLRNLDQARVKASEWHRSDIGRAWHREHAKRSLPHLRERDEQDG